MGIVDTERLEACMDCVIFVANGDLPEGDETLVDRIEAHNPFVLSDEECDRHGSVRGMLVRDIVFGGEDDEGDLGFSWRECECCGSRLGGDRHVLTAIIRRNPAL